MHDLNLTLFPDFRHTGEGVHPEPADFSGLIAFLQMAVGLGKISEAQAGILMAMVNRLGVSHRSVVRASSETIGKLVGQPEAFTRASIERLEAAGVLDVFQGAGRLPLGFRLRLPADVAAGRQLAQAAELPPLVKLSGSVLDTPRKPPLLKK